MKRLPQRIMNIVDKLDGLGGKCSMLAEGDPFDEPAFCEMPKIILLYNAEVLLSTCAKILEYAIARPLYALEKKQDNNRPPAWIYSA